MNAVPKPLPAAALELHGVSRRYGTLAALSKVDLAVAPGEIVCLLGSSGCGKSTLLRLIAGLESPDSGSIVMNGGVLSDPGTFVAPEARGIGLVFQDYALFPHLNLLDNVGFGLGGERAARRDAARIALARVRLDSRALDFPHMLSGGEQQRVALARALAPEPRLMLLDEPFSNLDRGLRERVRAETLGILRDARATAILVTHDAEEALRIADRIVLLREGRVEQDAAPESLYRRPTSLYAARFFSELIEFDGECRSGTVATPLGEFPAPGVSEGQKVRVGLRPHDIHLAPQGIEARLKERTFLGSAVSLGLELPGCLEPLTLQVAAPCAAGPGDTLRLRIDTQAAMIFASP